eukprot:gb/GFBE01081973.1/.p1 GENE.gb/GFBE01081973.1/~~gb/GFBE01081973.1/.p1  ORF type:complete len:153 (+),score=8.06 gb/GFBE01081973.1/:1-459(+)
MLVGCLVHTASAGPGGCNLPVVARGPRKAGWIPRPERQVLSVMAAAGSAAAATSSMSCSRAVSPSSKSRASRSKHSLSASSATLRSSKSPELEVPWQTVLRIVAALMVFACLINGWMSGEQAKIDGALIIFAVYSVVRRSLPATTPHKHEEP